MSIFFYIKYFVRSVEVSRPGFWLITFWLYIAACGGNEKLVNSVPFWVGAFYCLYPLNLLTFSWNDLGDVKLDAINPRKGKYLLGVNNVDNLSLTSFRNFSLSLNACFWIYFATIMGFQKAALLSSIVVGANYLYNSGPKWRQGPPPRDLCGALGYIFVLQLGVWLNDLENVPAATWFFHFFMIFRSQLWGQIIDLEPDQRSGRKTTAVTLGVVGARKLLLFLVGCELTVACFGFEDRYVSLFSLLCFLQAIVELLFYPPKPPNLYLAALTGAVMTPAAGLLLPRVWLYGVFR